MEEKDTIIVCPLCSRNVPKPYQTKHHLIPKAKKGRVTKLICKNCHSKIHRTFTLKELEHEYNTIEDIQTHDEFKKWIEFVSKKPNDFLITMKGKRKR